MYQHWANLNIWTLEPLVLASGLKGDGPMHTLNLRNIPIAVGVAAALVTCLAPPALAQLDGEHPAFRVDARRTGRSVYAGADDSLIHWRTDLGGILSSPAIDSDGTIYAGSFNSTLYAVNRDGSVKWEYPTAGWISSSPAIGKDGTVFVGSQDNYLHAVNPDGTNKWKYWTGQPPSLPAPVYTSPVISRNNVLLFTSDRGMVYANDADTGASLWTANIAPYSLSSPSVGDDGTVYVGDANGDLHSIRADGSTAWKFHTGNRIGTAPAIGDDGTIYVTSADGNCYAINPNGTRKWAYASMGAIGSSPTIGYDGTIYFGSNDGYFHAVNAATGTRKWMFMVGMQISSSATVDINNNLYFGGQDGKVYSVNSSGLLRWKTDVGSRIDSSPSIDSLGTVYIGTQGGELIAIGDANQVVANAPEPSSIILGLIAAPGIFALARRRRTS